LERSRQTNRPKIAGNLREFARVLARGGVRVAKPLIAIETGKPGAARRLGRFLGSDNGDRAFRLLAESRDPGKT
jgi:hypothetical protein